MSQPPGVVGWDIGGVNTKAARLAPDGASACRGISLPYEVQHQPSLLSATLRSAAERIAAHPDDRHAVTMTAELSQAFRTKRQGVAFVLDALEASFPHDRLHVYTVPGEFVSPAEARTRPLEVAASNWAAAASWVARSIPDCILMDIGTTTSDLIPIQGGGVAATGRTDPERLRTGELVYTGALRTPVEAMAGRLSLRTGTTRLSAEGFALSGDVHLWLGHIEEKEYTCPTPDGRPARRTYAGERLARALCGDRDLLEEPDITDLAGALARAQLQTLQEALETVRQRHPGIDTAVITGLGAFLAAQVARELGLRVVRLSETLAASPQTAPATAVAHLLRARLSNTP